MAPTEGLVARDRVCGVGFRLDRGVCVRDGWHFWGRWVLAGILLFVGVVAVFFCLCCSARARKRGTRPFGGAGWGNGRWFGRSKMGQQQQQQQPGYYGMSNQGAAAGGYDANQYGGGAYPPAYSQPPQAPAYNPGEGYYTGQQYGVQRPDSTYQPTK